MIKEVFFQKIVDHISDHYRKAAFAMITPHNIPFQFNRGKINNSFFIWQFINLHYFIKKNDVLS